VWLWDPEKGFEATKGVWAKETSAQSSIYRETHNLVIKLEEMALQGSLHTACRH
jgi:hypothetical protein